MVNSNSNTDDKRSSSIDDLIKMEEKKNLINDEKSLAQTFYLLQKNSQALIEQIQKKDERMKRQDRQINDLCSRIREILDRDVENSLLEDFEGDAVFAEKSEQEIGEEFKKIKEKEDEELEKEIQEELERVEKEEQEEKKSAEKTGTSKNDSKVAQSEQAKDTDQNEEKEKAKNLWDKFRNIIKSN